MDRSILCADQGMFPQKRNWKADLPFYSMPSIISSFPLSENPTFFFFLHTTAKVYSAFLNIKYKHNKSNWKIKCEILNGKIAETSFF